MSPKARTFLSETDYFLTAVVGKVLLTAHLYLIYAKGKMSVFPFVFLGEAEKKREGTAFCSPLSEIKDLIRRQVIFLPFDF